MSSDILYLGNRVVWCYGWCFSWNSFYVLTGRALTLYIDISHTLIDIIILCVPTTVVGSLRQRAFSSGHFYQGVLLWPNSLYWRCPSISPLGFLFLFPRGSIIINVCSSCTLLVLYLHMIKPPHMFASTELFNSCSYLELVYLDWMCCGCAEMCITNFNTNVIARTYASSHLPLTYLPPHVVLCRLGAWHANVFGLLPPQSSSGFWTYPLSPGLAITALVCLDFAFHLRSSVISFSWPHLYHKEIVARTYATTIYYILCIMIWCGMNSLVDTSGCFSSAMTPSRWIATAGSHRRRPTSSPAVY